MSDVRKDYGPTFGDERLPRRFWDKVNLDETTGCWIWQAQINDGGYGAIHWHRKPMQRAHRVAYEELIGPIPEGLVIDHLCKARACVNPSHLEPVTNGENVLRGDGPSAKNAQVARCPQGHEYTPENTMTRRRTDGRLKRECHQCNRDRAARNWRAGTSTKQTRRTKPQGDRHV